MCLWPPHSVSVYSYGTPQGRVRVPIDSYRRQKLPQFLTFETGPVPIPIANSRSDAEPRYSYSYEYVSCLVPKVRNPPQFLTFETTRIRSPAPRPARTPPRPAPYITSFLLSPRAAPLRCANQITRIALREFCVRHVSQTAIYFLAKPPHDCDYSIPISDRNVGWVDFRIVGGNHIYLMRAE